MSFAALMTLLQCVAKFQSDSDCEQSTVLESDELLLASLNLVRQLTAYFVSELIQRCKKKEVGSEFRAVLTKIVNDVIVALGSPDWPIAAILVDTIVLRIVKELTNSEVESAPKRDTSFCNQLLEILAYIGSSFSNFLKTQRIEQKNAESCILSTELLKQASAKFLKQRPFWMDRLGQEKQNLLDSLENEDEERRKHTTDEVLRVGDPIDAQYNSMVGQTVWYPAKVTKVHGNGFYDLVYDEYWKGRPVHENNIAAKFIKKLHKTGDSISQVSAQKRRGRKSKAEKHDDTHEEERSLSDTKSEDTHVDMQVYFNIKQAYEILLEITSVTMDLMTMHHMSSLPPAPLQVLAQCEGLDDIKKMVPSLSNTDIAQKMVLNFLELSSSSSVPHVKDAFALSLSMWLNDKNSAASGSEAYSTDNDSVKEYVREMVGLSVPPNDH